MLSFGTNVNMKIWTLEMLIRKSSAYKDIYCTKPPLLKLVMPQLYREAIVSSSMALRKVGVFDLCTSIIDK